MALFTVCQGIVCGVFCFSLSKLGFWPPLTYCHLFGTKKRVEIDNGAEYLQRVEAGSEFNL